MTTRERAIQAAEVLAEALGFERDERSRAWRRAVEVAVDHLAAHVAEAERERDAARMEVHQLGDLIARNADNFRLAARRAEIAESTLREAGRIASAFCLRESIAWDGGCDGRASGCPFCRIAALGEVTSVRLTAGRTETR